MNGAEMELMGIREIAQAMVVSPARAHRICHGHVAFPAPAARLAMGPVWIKADVEDFLDKWDRKPGRPPVRITK